MEKGRTSNGSDPFVIARRLAHYGPTSLPYDSGSQDFRRFHSYGLGSNFISPARQVSSLRPALGDSGHVHKIHSHLQCLVNDVRPRPYVGSPLKMRYDLPNMQKVTLPNCPSRSVMVVSLSKRMIAGITVRAESRSETSKRAVARGMVPFTDAHVRSGRMGSACWNKLVTFGIPLMIVFPSLRSRWMTGPRVGWR
jgi:hypothetical protein